MMSLTSGIVSKALFDVDITSEAEGVQVALDAVMDFNNCTLVGYPPSNLRYQRAIQQLDAIVYRIINQRRASGRTRVICSPCCSRCGTKNMELR